MNRTTTVIVALIAAASLSTIVYTGPQQQALAHRVAAQAISPVGVAPYSGSWLTAPYGDYPDAAFFCGIGLRQYTGYGQYGCGNGPDGGIVYGIGNFIGPWGWGGGFGGFGGGFFGDGCGIGFGCGGCGVGICGGGFFGDPFGWHKHVIQDANQVNNCQPGEGNHPDAVASPPVMNGTGNNSEDQSDYSAAATGAHNLPTTCLNTGVNSAGHSFGGFGPGLGVGAGRLG